MVDEFKSFRDALFKVVSAGLAANEEERPSLSGALGRLDLKTARDLLGALAGWAGKGKDEVIQILCREIGIAIAAVIKEPITQILAGRKLQLTIELIPKEKSGKAKSSGKTRSTKSRRRSSQGKESPRKSNLL